MTEITVPTSTSTPAVTVPEAKSRSVRVPVFVVTALGAFLASLDLSIVNVAFPSLLRSFPTVSTAELSWVVTAYAIVFAALLITSGRTADRVGRRRIFFAGLAAFTIGSAGCGLAPGVGTLIAARGVQGAGAALLLPSSLGLLLMSTRESARSQVVALWGGIGALAVATGPSLGAAIVDAGGWRWAFYVNLPFALAAYVVGQRVLPDDRVVVRAPRADFLGVVLIAAAVSALVLAVSNAPDWGWTDGRAVGAILLALVLAVLFVQRCRRHPEPVLDLILFRSRTFSVANAVTFIYALGFFAMLLGNILFLTAVWRYSILDAGLAVTPGPLVVAVIAGPAGRLAARRGPRPVLLTGLVIFTLGLGWYVLRVGSDPSYLAEWLPGTLVCGLGIGLSFPVLSAAAVSELPAHGYAVGSAVNQTARQIGGAIGIAVLAAVLGSATKPGASIDHYRTLWAVTAATTAVAAFLATRLTRSAKNPSASASAGRDRYASS
ncbi:MAG: MFS transporter [Mycobacteriaceae bacterium]|nr:MFS transporter [Mycobacteriaceae bacterium]